MNFVEKNYQSNLYTKAKSKQIRFAMIWHIKDKEMI